MKFNVYWEYVEWYLVFAENMQKEIYCLLGICKKKFNAYWNMWNEI